MSRTENDKIKKVSFFLFSALFSLCASAAQAGQSNYTGHATVSMMSTVSLTEVSAVRFGNFTVTSSGHGDASIVLRTDGSRQSYNGVDMIVLLNGGATYPVDPGSQGPGYYHVAGATPGTQLYVTFTDHGGAAITPSNQVTLTGPGGSGVFYVDSMNFNSGATYVTADGGGNATIIVGATLHTEASGGITYAPGTYRGTFELMISY